LFEVVELEGFTLFQGTVSESLFFVLVTEIKFAWFCVACVSWLFSAAFVDHVTMDLAILSKKGKIETRLKNKNK